MKLTITKSSNASLSKSERLNIINVFIDQGFSTPSNGEIVDIRNQIRKFEAIYSIPSSQIETAIQSGTIKETDEIVRWIFLRNILNRVQKIEA